MRIALVSTCAAPTPPPAYGGIERFVAELARGLVARGHDVIVYATGDSKPAGRLRSSVERPIWPPDFAAEAAHARFALHDVDTVAPDIVHVNRPDALLPDDEWPCPVVVTLHDIRRPELVPMYERSDATCVAISKRQASLLPELRRLVVIEHGLDADAFPLGAGNGGYCAFLGRIGPEKAPHRAIDAALEARVRLRIGGPHWVGDPDYDRYFAEQFAPRIERADGRVQWLGELDQNAKVELLRGASALLFPLGWDEPFGLVMIEAMLIGTPVVAFDRGSAPEIVDEGITGYLARDAHAMAQAVPRAASLDRTRCRARAARRFSASRMVRRYEALYRSLCEARRFIAARSSDRARHEGRRRAD
ncbi:MAG TPA: glycosyltransferase family 4 protein [Casimicrobiaceae bacterium]|nr:glycosyltransferase family 4 protein [Casimicrobiaceae bacterium]